MASKVARAVATRDSASRFFNLRLIEFRGRFVPDLGSFKATESNVQEGTAIVSRPARLDLIAEQAYRDPQLFWIIAAANEIEDPFNVPEGTILRIPSIDFITAFATARL